MKIEPAKSESESYRKGDGFGPAGGDCSKCGEWRRGWSNGMLVSSFTWLWFLSLNDGAVGVWLSLELMVASVAVACRG